MHERTIRFRTHAIQRLFERGITPEQVRQVIEEGVIIQQYPDDTPYPSALYLGWCEHRPIHVVAADDAEHAVTIIITVCEPDPEMWDNEFKRKRR